MNINYSLGMLIGISAVILVFLYGKKVLAKIGLDVERHDTLHHLIIAVVCFLIITIAITQTQGS